MRESLRIAVKNTIILECRLPHVESGIGKSCISHKYDRCLSSQNGTELSRVIYNGIVEYAVNQYRINYNELDKEQLKTIRSKIRYDSSAEQSTKLRYGFYGEVLLDLILRCYMKTDVLIARGYFYLPTNNSEMTGFDAFHLVESKDKLSLWFGEAKFYIDYKAAIKSVLDKIHISLSDNYVNTNLIALIDRQQNFTATSSRIETLLSTWEENPLINLAQEMKAQNIDLVYPIFIAYKKTDKVSYHKNIECCIDYIKEQVDLLKIKISASFDYRISFIFLPIDEVTNVKKQVIEWIEAHEPLLP